MFAAAFVGGLLVSSVSVARELSLEVQAESIYDDNLFNTSEDEEHDLYFRVSPLLRFEEPRGNLEWMLEYRPSYNYYTRFSELRGFDHDLHGRASWRLGRNTRLTVNDRFRRYGFESRFNESTDVAAGDDPVVTRRNQRSRLLTNNASLALEHQFGPRHQASLQGFHQIYDREDRGTDVEGYGVNGQYFYVATSRLRFGPGLSWNRRIQKPGFGRDTETDFVNLSGRVVYQFSPTFSFDASAGPAWVLSDDADLVDSAEVRRIPGTGLGVIDVTTCPTLDDGTPFLGVGCEPLALFENEVIDPESGLSGPVPFSFDPSAQFFQSYSLPIAGLPSANESALFAEDRVQGSTQIPLVDAPSGGGTDLTYFADASLTKRWKNWVLRLGYRRSDDSTASNFRVTAISDRVYGSLHWRVSEKLSMGLNVSWLRREQEQEQFFPVVALSNTSLLVDSRLCGAAGGCPPGTVFGRRITFMNVAAADVLRAQTFDGEFTTENTQVRLNTRYRLRERLTLVGVVTFRHEKQSGNLGFEATTEQFVGWLGLEYEFEPWRF